MISEPSLETIDEQVATFTDFTFDFIVCSMCEDAVTFDVATIQTMTKDEIRNLVTIIQLYGASLSPSNKLGCAIARKLLPRFFKGKAKP
jgi:hypothetical protein